MPEADRERIFESFQQGGRGSSREEGTGLGLTLSAASSSCSAAGCGSRARSAWAARSASRSRRRERDGVERRDESAEAPLVGQVVVIEDDRPSLDLLTAYLSGMAAGGHHGSGRPVRPRRGAAGAARRRAARHPAAGHRRLGGAEGAQGGPGRRGTSRSIVVSIVDERARGVALGAAAYLVKPVSRDDLLAALTTVACCPDRPHRHPADGHEP